MCVPIHPIHVFQSKMRKNEIKWPLNVHAGAKLTQYMTVFDPNPSQPVVSAELLNGGGAGITIFPPRVTHD